MIPDTGDSDSRWPFTIPDLTAGLRRHFGQPTLRIVRLWPEPLAARPAIGTLRGLGVEMEFERDGRSLNQTHSFVLKEPLCGTRAGLAGVGLREVGVYRTLSIPLPLATPRLVAAHAGGAWMVMERLPARPAQAAWTEGNYRGAVAGLARLHVRFWGL